MMGLFRVRTRVQVYEILRGDKIETWYFPEIREHMFCNWEGIPVLETSNGYRECSTRDIEKAYHAIDKALLKLSKAKTPKMKLVRTITYP